MGAAWDRPAAETANWPALVMGYSGYESPPWDREARPGTTVAALSQIDLLNHESRDHGSGGPSCLHGAERGAGVACRVWTAFLFKRAHGSSPHESRPHRLSWCGVWRGACERERGRWLFHCQSQRREASTDTILSVCGLTSTLAWYIAALLVVLQGVLANTDPHRHKSPALDPFLGA